MGGGSISPVGAGIEGSASILSAALPLPHRRDPDALRRARAPRHGFGAPLSGRERQQHPDRTGRRNLCAELGIRGVLRARSGSDPNGPQGLLQTVADPDETDDGLRGLGDPDRQDLDETAGHTSGRRAADRHDQIGAGCPQRGGDLSGWVRVGPTRTPITAASARLSSATWTHEERRVGTEVQHVDAAAPQRDREGERPDLVPQPCGRPTDWRRRPRAAAHRTARGAGAGQPRRRTSAATSIRPSASVPSAETAGSSESFTPPSHEPRARTPSITVSMLTVS